MKCKYIFPYYYFESGVGNKNESCGNWDSGWDRWKLWELR